MTLKERLASLPDDEYIYLGTENGSAWIWICQNKDMIMKCNELNMSLRASKERSLASRELHIEKAQNQILVVKEALKSSKTKQAKAENRLALKNLREDIKVTRKQIAEIREYFANWVDLQDREVVGEDPHTVETDGIGIQVRGNENGNYWLLSEIDMPLRKVG